MKFITDYLQAKKDNVVLRQKIIELQQSVGDTAKLYNTTFEQLTKVTGKFTSLEQHYKEVCTEAIDIKVELQEAHHTIEKLKQENAAIANELKTAKLHEENLIEDIDSLQEYHTDTSNDYVHKIDVLKYRKRILCKKYKLTTATLVCIITAQGCYILSHIFGV